MRTKALFVVITVLFWVSNSIAVELTTSFQTASAPKYIGKTGKSGICFDIIHALNGELKGISIAENAQVKPLKRIKYELEVGDIDIFVGLAQNTARKKLFNFIPTPAYLMKATFGKLKSDSFDYQGEDSLRGKTIATIAGSKTEKQMQKISGVMIDSSPDVQSAIKKVSAGRTDLVFYHKIGILYNVKLLGVSNVDTTTSAFKDYGHYVAFSKKVDASTIAAVEAALKIIQSNGTLEKISLKYQP